jgi:hypothetical protein
MRVTVLVDAYNLYYAGRKLCDRGVAGWRWLDIRSLAGALAAEQAALWPGAMVARVVYCTARISGGANPGGGYTAGRLPAAPGAGVGRHWWRTLRAPDFAAHQLPDPAGGHQRPAGW